MKCVAMIPARYAASRFPGKLMQVLGDKTIIRHTYENTVATRLFDEVIVVTDSDVIFDEIVSNGGYAVMSKKNHESGSDRIAEAVADMDVDVILNVQGDEPFINKESLQNLLHAFDGNDNKVQVASLMKQITDDELISNPNCVKVVVDNQNYSLLFSRSPIPFIRDSNIAAKYFQHIGVYAFRKPTLMLFTAWQPTYLESIEKIECLRYLENGIPLKMILTTHVGISIDTPADFDKAEKFYSGL